MQGVERIQNAIQQNLEDRIHFLYGQGLDDTYISIDHQEIGIEEAILQVLKHNGFQRVAFIAPHKSVYYLDEFSQRSSHPGNRDDQKEEIALDRQNKIADRQSDSEAMRFLLDGPLGDRVLFVPPELNDQSLLSGTGMGDVHAIRLLDTLMKDTRGIKSAVVILQAESTLRFFDDHRTLAGIIGEWERLPASNQNSCFLLFSASSYQELCGVATNLPVPELRKNILQRQRKSTKDNNLIQINGPEKPEILRLIESYRRRNDLEIDEFDLSKLAEWMAAENRNNRYWLRRLNDLQTLNLDTARKNGWFSGCRDTDLSSREQLRNLVGLAEIKGR
ncbi:MAG: hypothetical protein MUO76_13715, partial [Anaerolineaceae bacterium]|nr:hypothetical protein [Anaerolineaceae bacterium]